MKTDLGQPCGWLPLRQEKFPLALFRGSVCVLSILLFSLVAGADSANFKTTEVAKDVYAVIAKPGMYADWGRCNATFIVNQTDVVVVDTQMRPSQAAEVVSEIKKVTDKPVRYVINTHWHRDHTQGNQVYLDTFGPGVSIIQQEFAREDQLKNQPNELGVRAPQELAKVKQLLADDKDEKGNPLDAAGRTRLSELFLAEQTYAYEIPSIRMTPGTTTYSERMVLYEGNREIHLYYFGFAHTRGDTVVYLPAEKVVITGDMSQSGVPDTRHSYPLEWQNTLKSMLALDWTINIPGHGPVQNGKDTVNGFMAYLNDLVSGVKAAVAKQMTAEQTVASVDLTKYSSRTDYADKNELAIHRVYDELHGKIQP
jgi:glyoxylase-like metal-dependent hydrolase (beta-lactamase superfamily II)